jgi:ankyrin repeat protein
MNKIINNTGADVTATDERRATALHAACAAGSLGASVILLRARASPTALDRNGSSPLDIAGTR